MCDTGLLSVAAIFFFVGVAGWMGLFLVRKRKEWGRKMIDPRSTDVKRTNGLVIDTFYQITLSTDNDDGEEGDTHTPETRPTETRTDYFEVIFESNVGAVKRIFELKVTTQHYWDCRPGSVVKVAYDETDPAELSIVVVNEEARTEGRDDCFATCFCSLFGTVFSIIGLLCFAFSECIMLAIPIAILICCFGIFGAYAGSTHACWKLLPKVGQITKGRFEGSSPLEGTDEELLAQMATKKATTEITEPAEELLHEARNLQEADKGFAGAEILGISLGTWEQSELRVTSEL